MTNGPLSRPDAGTHRFCIAPMMDCTDRHFRYFIRRITRHARLYTEMIPTGALLYGDRRRFLDFSPEEHPLAVQLGGGDPYELAECARLATDWGYDEINLNVGCPSDRVQKARFGACLMATPDVVARAVEAMGKVTSLPITVKHRLGIDTQGSYQDLRNFVNIVRRAGCRHFIVHARIAILKGLGPKQNRSVPPLRYEMVYQLKKDFPDCTIVINGGIRNLDAVQHHLRFVDGVMVGRAAYENPYFLSLVDSVVFGVNQTPPSRREIIQAMIPYLDQCLQEGIHPHRVVRHMSGLFAHQPGARRWRQLLSQQAPSTKRRGNILREALALIPEKVLDQRSSAHSLSLENKDRII